MNDQSPESRAAWCKAMREFVDLVESEPTIPVPDDVTIWSHLWPREGGMTQGQRIAAVHDFAERFGVPVQNLGREHRQTSKTIGQISMHVHSYPETDPGKGCRRTSRVVSRSDDTGLLADESQRVVNAYLDGQSEVDQLLVEEELGRQAETEAKGLGWCGAQAVDPQGETGRCVLHKGHDDAGSWLYVARLEGAHFDPAFGHWDATGTVRRAAHVESDEKPGTCRHCDSTVPGKGYCVFAPPDAESAAEPARDESLDEQMVAMGALGEVDV